MFPVVGALVGTITGAALVLAHVARLPELFCGFERLPGEPPIAYPVACLPQAWAAGSVFLMLQSALGIDIDATTGTVGINDPILPAGIDRLSISNLQVGDGRIDLAFQQMGNQTVVIPLHREGPVTVRTVG